MNDKILHMHKPAKCRQHTKLSEYAESFTVKALETVRTTPYTLDSSAMLVAVCRISLNFSCVVAWRSTTM